ncbi:MAG: NCS2 family permease [Acidobacteria bacterium]|nr:NCS2 family permease [Acidobacteriota bacterium]
MKTLIRRAERYFEFERLGANWRTEVIAGLTTFITMAYIVFVNPAILSETGMPLAAVTAATCVSAAFGSLLMGLWARYPIALAPGMGLNAYFTYSVVQGMGVTWPVALGAVFLSGVLFLVLTMAGVRQLIVEAIPKDLYAAVAVGIGLFIAFIGFRNAGLVVGHPATFVTLGNLKNPATALALGSLLFTCALMARGVKAAMLIGMAVTTAAGALLGLVTWNPQSYSPAAMTATAGALDIGGALRLGLAEIVFVFLFVDLFDNVGTLVAVGTKARLFNETNRIPRIGRILTADAAATIAGSLAGTSTVVSYIESAAGVVAGGRTGVTAMVTGLLFLVALFLAPLAGAIPAAATAPALIVVGALMISHVRDIDWNDLRAAVPAFLVITIVPFSFSIANGLAFGFIAHTVLRVLAGQARQIGWLVYLLTALFLARFLYLGAG